MFPIVQPNGFYFCLSTAPSQVMAIRQENASQNSVILFWHEPAQPNGVILEYDIKYYEKVGPRRKGSDIYSLSEKV